LGPECAEVRPDAGWVSARCRLGKTPVREKTQFGDETRHRRRGGAGTGG
jgi:hypothetical protein